jgi:hypothetical protein
VAIYPDVLRELTEVCTQYRQGAIAERQLQECFARAEDTVVAVDEKEHRQFLHWAENQLELLQFTVGKAQLHQETLQLVGQVEQHVKDWDVDCGEAAKVPATKSSMPG